MRCLQTLLVQLEVLTCNKHWHGAHDKKPPWGQTSAQVCCAAGSVRWCGKQESEGLAAFARDSAWDIPLRASSPPACPSCHPMNILPCSISSRPGALPESPWVEFWLPFWVARHAQQRQHREGRCDW